MVDLSFLSKATLGIVAGNVAARVDGGVASNVSNTRTYRELAKRAGRTILGITILDKRTAGMNDVLEWPSADLIEMPPMATTIAAQRHTLAARAAIVEIARRSDVLFVRMPFQIPWALLGLRRPKLLHFGSDVHEIVRASTDYRGVMRAAALSYARLGEATFQVLMREPSTRVATNGRALHRKYRVGDRGIDVVSSCLYEREVDPLEIRALHPPPRILFVGYLRPEKGIEVLLDAFDSVRAQRPLQLTIVGGSDRQTDTGRRIAERLERSPYRDDIDLAGHVAFGEPLFDLYRSHDVLVLPSLSEGTPRTLIEARAFGCPVIGSDVGGIGTSIAHSQDGLLFVPGRADGLAKAINRILDDTSLRARLIEGGHTRALDTTVERFVDRLAGQLELALGGRP